MKRAILLFVIFLFLVNFSSAQTQLSSAEVTWIKNKIPNTLKYNPGTQATISPDIGTLVNVTIHRTTNASLPATFMVADLNNNSPKMEVSSASGVTFSDCAGSLDTELWISVNTNVGLVRVIVLWTKTATPDLTVSNVTVNNNTLPSGMSYLVGQTVDINCNVWNISKANAGPSKLGLYIKPSSGSTSGSPNMWNQVSSIAPGGGSPQQFSYTFTSGDIGDRYFVLNADYTNVVNEASETNNVRSFGSFKVSGQVNMNLTPTSFQFGNVNVNKCSGEQSFTLTNNSTESVSGFVSLNNITHYSIVTGGESFSLNSGTSKTITIKFCPQAIGSLSTIFKVVVDGTSAPVSQATLSGTGISPPETIIAYSPEFLFDTKKIAADSGGIFLKIIETGNTKLVSKVGYEFSWENGDSIAKFDVDDNGFVFLKAPVFPEDAKTMDDFRNKILLFNGQEELIGHIAFEYSFEWESTQARQAIIFLHNDGLIFGGKEDDSNRYFPYHINSPNNPVNDKGQKVKYNYYEFGEYPVSMLIPPSTFDGNNISRGFVIPDDYKKKPVLFVHGLTGTFSYQDALQVKKTKQIGDQVSYWFDTPQKLNLKTEDGPSSPRKYHAWQFYYPNEDDLTHCGLMLGNAINYLDSLYLTSINIVAHSMGGLVTMGYLTNGNYNNEIIGKILLTTSSIHGSLSATRNYRTLLGYTVGKQMGFDPNAPCYRDLSIGSDFIYNLHSRPWEENLVANTFVLLGLTTDQYKEILWGLLDIEFAHIEAKNHSDGVVSFSSASLLDKGIGFLGIYGNHDDGKYSKTLENKYFIPDMIDAYLSDNTSGHVNFTNICLNDSTVEIFVDGNSNVLKPEGKTLNNVKSIRSDVDYQKGMVTIIDKEELSTDLYLFLREKIFITNKVDYVLSPDRFQISLIYNYTYLGKYSRNRFNTIFGYGSSYYFTKDLRLIIIPIPGPVQVPIWWEDNTGFEFQKDVKKVVKIPESKMPKSFDIEPLVLKHQFIGDIVVKKDLTIPLELTPTKEIKVFADVNKSFKEIFIDDQTTLAEFYLYNEELEGENIEYSMFLISPDGEQIDLTSSNISYFSDPYTSVKRITVQNPLPGKWKVFPEIDPSVNIKSFITNGKLSSGIVFRSSTEKKNPVNIAGIVSVPDLTKLKTDSLSAYAIITNESGQSDTIKLIEIQTSGAELTLKRGYNPTVMGNYRYTMIVTGNYNNYRFERAVYGSFTIESNIVVLTVPDVELNYTKPFVNVQLPQYLFCNQCDPVLIDYEVGVYGSTFKDEDFDISYLPETKTLSIAVMENSQLAEAFFTVKCSSGDAIMARDTFRVSNTPMGIPVDLIASSITRNSAELSWIPKGTESKWEIKYGLAGFNPNTEGTLLSNIVSIPFNLVGLQQGVAYDFYVRANFDVDPMVTGWSWPGNFVTNHLINITSGVDGTADPIGEKEAIHYNNFEINFSPNEGYHVDNVNVDGKSIGGVSSYQFDQVMENHTVNVTFHINSYNIESTVYPPQSGTTIGAGKFTHGETVNLTALPASSYEFVNWREYGVTLGNTSALSFNAFTNRKLIANFTLTTGIKDNLSGNVSIYPNPSNSKVTISLNNGQKISQLKVFNILGYKLINRNLNNENSYILDVKDWSQGLYLVQIATSSGIINTKFQVVK